MSPNYTIPNLGVRNYGLALKSKLIYLLFYGNYTNIVQ